MQRRLTGLDMIWSHVNEVVAVNDLGRLRKIQTHEAFGEAAAAPTKMLASAAVKR